MKNQIKFKGFLNSYRLKIKQTMDYTDGEYRLWDVLIHIADWDEKHTETFGTTGESLRDIQKHYLSWSTGKLSETIKSLTKRGLVERRPGGRLEIKKFKYLISKSVRDIERFYGVSDESSVHPDEQGVQAVEQQIHSTEHPAHSTEQAAKSQIGNRGTRKPLNTSENVMPVHPDEEVKSAKEQSKKSFKEIQTNADEMLLINKLIEKYGNDIKRPLSKFSVTSVRDSARRVESRIQGGEKVINCVGYITILCKDGITWEESEEKAREDGFGAPQLEYGEIKPRGKHHRFSSLEKTDVWSPVKAPEIKVSNLTEIPTTDKKKEANDTGDSPTKEEQARASARIAQIKSELNAKFNLKRNPDENLH
jgi:DNA-binding MarR family transcriptional regulator